MQEMKLSVTQKYESLLCNDNDPYILGRGKITTIGNNLVTEVAFENCAPFTKSITKIDGKTIDTED